MCGHCFLGGFNGFKASLFQVKLRVVSEKYTVVGKMKATATLTPLTAKIGGQPLLPNVND